jgi:hypothetical protein
MSAIEVIEQFKELSREEQKRVVAFVNSWPDADESHDGSAVRYMDARKAKAVSAEIFSEHAELFRKLAS